MANITTSTDKIFEKNSSFHVKLRTTGKVSIFKGTFASIGKILFLGGGVGTRHHDIDWAP